MLKKKLGYTELNFTTIGFGAWAVGGGDWDWGWGKQDDQESIEAFQKGLDLGINWIDTAAAYGLGHSEEVIKEALQARKDDVYISTKCGLVWDNTTDGTVENRLKAWSVRQELEASLRRLGVERIDLYQIHWPKPDEDIEEAWTEIAKLIEEGKVRYGGVSNCSISQMERLQKIHPIASLQPEYNMFERNIEGDVLNYCSENNIGVVAYSPMASGLLTGKYNRETIKNIHPEDWRLKYSEHFSEENFVSNVKKVEKLQEISKDLGVSLVELAVAWVLRKKEITAAIVGSRRASQIEQVVPAADLHLSSDVIEKIEKILD